jgi:hypothetical protein
MNKNALVKHSAINMISYRIEEEQEEEKKRTDHQSLQVSNFLSSNLSFPFDIHIHSVVHMQTSYN